MTGQVDEIEDAAHRLCAALHMNGIMPQRVEIHLPEKDWWRLWTRLETKFRGLMPFDGRGSVPVEFSFMGIKYKPMANDR